MSNVLRNGISQALDNKFIMKSIVLDISKAFDKVLHWELLHKLFTYRISGRDVSIIKSFLKGRSLKVIDNGQSSKGLKINAGILQGSLLDPTLFLLHINDMSIL